MSTPEIPLSPRAVAGSGPPLLPIDTDFDVALADRLARRESYNKHHYRPNSYLHKWWARRCGTTFRLILKHLVEDEARRDYYAAGGLEGRVVLDPMLGGGTTLHEALRLGAAVIGVDIDPVPVLQARATLSEVEPEQLEEGFAVLESALRERLTPFFRTRSPAGHPVPLRYTLYAARRRCACGDLLQADSLVLRHERDGGVHYLHPVTHAIHFSATGVPDLVLRRAGDRPLLLTRNEDRCPLCTAPLVEDTALPLYRRYIPLVIVGREPDGQLFFKRPDEEDLARIAAADAEREGPAWEGDFAIPDGPKSADLHFRHVHDFRDCFTSRQLLYLAAARDHLATMSDPLLRLNLALLVSTSLEFNSLLCGYKGGNRHRPGAIRHAFAHHGYAFPYTALENHPLYPLRRRQASGTLPKLFHDRLRRARRWARAPREPRLETGRRARFTVVGGERDQGTEVAAVGELSGSQRFMLRNRSAVALDLPGGSVDFVVTDPPYFDSVQYGDLAAFFRVWLRQLLPAALLPEYAPEAAAVDPRRADEAGYAYRSVLGDIFAGCRRVLRAPHGRLIFTFHHGRAAGWRALTLALRDAEFVLVNRYVVHAENPRSVHMRGAGAVTHDAILVLAPRAWAPAVGWDRPVPPLAPSDKEGATFVEACASLLGYLLAADLSEAQITAQWREAMG